MLSVFVATFAYSTAGLYTVGISGGSRIEEFARLAVTDPILLLFASLGFLIHFVDHLAHSIQLHTIIDVVQQKTSVVIAQLPDTGETGALAVPAQAVPISTWRSGYIQSVHPEDLYVISFCARELCAWTMSFVYADKAQHSPPPLWMDCARNASSARWRSLLPPQTISRFLQPFSYH